MKTRLAPIALTSRPRAARAGLVAALAMVVACAARTAPCATLAGFDPTLLGLTRVGTAGEPLAQRVIEREWGPADDSIYVEKEIPGLKSEAMAGGLSFVLPGAGQMYLGGKSNMRRGAVYALAEIAAWTARIMLHNSGTEVRADAARFAGVPTDTTSAWSLERWARLTQSDPSDLARLYAANPEEFYDVIESPQYQAGWTGDAPANQEHFVELRATSDRRLHGARASQSFLWVNHVASAFDALWAARSHNMTLGPALGLDVRGGIRRGRPELMAILVKKF